MASFAVAQIFYITAFGFKPLKVYIGIIIYAVGALSKNFNLFIFRRDKNYQNVFRMILMKIFFDANLFSISTIFPLGLAVLFKNITGVLLYGIPIYCSLLLTMAWRSVARIENFSSFLQILCGIGGISFAISDTLIAFSMFYGHIPYSKILIMSTYYFAQFGITLSILDVASKDRKSN